MPIHLIYNCRHLFPPLYDTKDTIHMPNHFHIEDVSSATHQAQLLKIDVSTKFFRVTLDRLKTPVMFFAMDSEGLLLITNSKIYFMRSWTCKRLFKDDNGSIELLAVKGLHRVYCQQIIDKADLLPFSHPARLIVLKQRLLENAGA